jgi:hypothetical protein
MVVLAGAGRKPGQLSKCSLEAIKHLGPVGERYHLFGRPE